MEKSLASLREAVEALSELDIEYHKLIHDESSSKLEDLSNQIQELQSHLIKDDSLNNTLFSELETLDRVLTLFKLSKKAGRLSKPTRQSSSPSKTHVLSDNNAERMKNILLNCELTGPHSTEIISAQYPDHVKNPVNDLRPSSSQMPSPIFVNADSMFDSMMMHLSNVREIAVDIEHHSKYSYLGYICLIQISSRTQDYIIDPLNIKKATIARLSTIFLDPKVVKVFHGSSSDILWLQRDYDLYVVCLFDTYQAAQMLDLPKKSLSYLLEYYCEFQADKKYQNADWRERPLSKEMLSYAQADTHFLLYIYDRFRDALNFDADSIEYIHMLSKAEALLKYKLPPPLEAKSPVNFKALGQQRLVENLAPNHVTDYAYTLLCLLYTWRDTVARKLDVSTGFVLSNKNLIFCVRSKPRNLTDFNNVTYPKNFPKTVKTRLEIIACVNETDAMQQEGRLFKLSQSGIVSDELEVASTHAKEIEDITTNKIYQAIFDDSVPSSSFSKFICELLQDHQWEFGNATDYHTFISKTITLNEGQLHGVELNDSNLEILETPNSQSAVHSAQETKLDEPKIMDERDTLVYASSSRKDSKLKRTLATNKHAPFGASAIMSSAQKLWESNQEKASQWNMNNQKKRRNNR